MLHISLLTADCAKSESNSRWNSDAHNFGNFSTFAKLLDGVCMLHVVHGDSVDHYNSVILPGEGHQTETPWWRRKGHLIAVKRQKNPWERSLLQQAFSWASFQHVRDDDGGLAALKMRVIPTS